MPRSSCCAHICVLAAALAAFAAFTAAAREPVRPFEMPASDTPSNGIDDMVGAALEARGLDPAYPASDEVFVRRAYLDILGVIPEWREVVRFVRSPDAGKRAQLIEELFEREEFADYWALRWGDLLRIKAEFPINLWPNAVQAYHHWVCTAMRENMRYDQFARALLTSSGSNFRTPPVNFYRAVQERTPEGLAAAVALTFMGTRIDGWPEARRAEMAQFFSRVAYKKTAEWKEEIVYLDPAHTEPFRGEFPDGTAVTVSPRKDPRRVFADWLVAPDNPWFARNMANRVWAWFFGRGIVHEPDDLRPDNPAVLPELLDYLEAELVQSGFDLRHLFRLILNSRTYQQSSIPMAEHPDAQKWFACYPVRRLEAEVLADALSTVFGAPEAYSSRIPEPFTYVPEHHPTVALADGSITSAFLEKFGRPARDTGLYSERNNEFTDGQRLHLINSSHVQNKIRNSWRLRLMLKRSGGDPHRAIDAFYLGILSRRATDAEAQAVITHAESMELSTEEAGEDLAWALINTKEFLYRH